MRYCCERAVSRENPDDEARNLSPLGSVDLLGASVRTIEMQRDLLTVATVFVFSLSVYGSKPQWLHDEAKDTQSVALTVRSGLPFDIRGAIGYLTLCSRTCRVSVFRHLELITGQIIKAQHLCLIPSNTETSSLDQRCSDEP